MAFFVTQFSGTEDASQQEEATTSSSLGLPLRLPSVASLSSVATTGTNLSLPVPPRNRSVSSFATDSFTGSATLSMNGEEHGSTSVARFGQMVEASPIAEQSPIPSEFPGSSPGVPRGTSGIFFRQAQILNPDTANYHFVTRRTEMQGTFSTHLAEESTCTGGDVGGETPTSSYCAPVMSSPPR